MTRVYPANPPQAHGNFAAQPGCTFNPG